MKIRTLSNGVEMPSIGMGTYPLQGDAMTKAVVAAVKCGYLAFDTAHAYGNEISLGNALQEAYRVTGIQRTNVFVTSKIGEDLDHGTPNGKLFYATYPNEKRDIKGIVSKQLDTILKNLQTDYLDLLLIHWPFPDYFQEIWMTLEDEYKRGKVRSIGVSNCQIRHLEKLRKESIICPMINQFELHPLHTKKELLEYCHQKNIQVEAYSPLLVMNRKLINAPVLKDIARKFDKSIPQIILRWDIQNGVIPIPKSGNSIRLKENISIFDFELTDDDMKEINSLNEEFNSLVESRYCPGY